MSGNFRGLPNIVWLMIIGSGLSRGAFFMIFPFLAIHLRNKLGADITTIGWIIGAGPLLGAIVGFYGGYLSDVFGRRLIIIWTLILWGLVQVSFSFADTVLFFGILSALNGILRAVCEPVIQAVISDHSTGEARDRAYHYRYFVINIAAAIGPIFGSAILLKHSTAGFLFAGLSLILFSTAFAFHTRRTFITAEKSQTPPAFWAVMGILSQDRVLRYFVVASILTALAYTQTESTLPLILNDLFAEDGAKIFGWTIAANGITIVLFQLSLNKFTKNFNTVKTVAVSCVVFALGFAGFAVSGSHWWAYILSMIVLSLGEILVFSNGYILIDRLAPAHLRATYYGASNLFAIGMALGPPVGAYILSHTNQQTLFFLAAGLLFFVSLIYLRGDQVRHSLEK